MSAARIPWSLWGQAGIIVLGAFTSMLASTIVSPAAPVIAAALKTNVERTHWLTTGYLLALAAGVPLSAWASRRFGPTRLWLCGLGLFGVFTIVCALAPNMKLLLAGRVAQGFAGGLLVPAGQTIVGLLAGRERLARVLSITGIAVVVAPTLGTTLGGIVTDHLGWSACFWLDVPLCAVALACGMVWLPEVPTTAAGRMDWVGLLLTLTGLPLLIYGLSRLAGAGGRSTAAAAGPVVAGIVVLALFVLWSLRVRTPLLQLALFRGAPFALSAVIMVFGGAVNFGAQVILPLYFIEVRHHSALAAGLLIAPQVVGTAIGFPVAGWLTDRYGAGVLIAVGGGLTALATIPLATLGADTGDGVVATVLFVRGLGVALATIPAMTAGMAAVSHEHLPDAAPILNVLQRVGAATGTSVVAVLYASHAAGGAALGAFTYANWWLFAGAVLLVVPACLLAYTDARASSPDAAPDPLRAA